MAFPIDWLVTLFVLTGLLVFFLLWLYYDRRDRTLFDEQRLRSAHHCSKCGHLYSHVTKDEAVPCPRCGHPNYRLRF